MAGGETQRTGNRRALPGWKSAGGSTKIEKLLIPGTVGTLEALLESDPGAIPPLVTVVCHPHPVYGGTMHNKVVFHAAKAAVALGLPVLRFNFRGVGKSDGEFSDGVGERNDAVSALDYLKTRFPNTPVCVMGFSFGAWVGLSVGAADFEVAALVGLGLPVASENFDFLREVRKPKLVVQGTRDIYGPREQVEELFNSLRKPKQLHWVEGVDHFFTGRLDEVQSAIRAFLLPIISG
jgi:alpha/beta superfamily hydrolase